MQRLVGKNLILSFLQGFRAGPLLQRGLRRGSFFSSIQENEEELRKVDEEINMLKTKIMPTVEKKKNSFSEEQLQDLSSYEEFNLAVQYASIEQFALAEGQFTEVLHKLNESQPDRIDLQLIVMKSETMFLIMFDKRIVLMMKIQEKNHLLTPALEDLYFKHLAFYSSKNVEYVKILKNLLTHYCIHDLERGSFFLSMLLEQLQSEEIPKVILRDIYLYAGKYNTINKIIHALKGEDFEQSERFFQEAIKAGLQPIQKGIAYNNLACVTYWNCLKLLLKLSETPSEQTDVAKKLQEEITERIELVSPLLKRAFNAFEFEEKHRQTDQINEKQFIALKKLMDESLKVFDLTGLVTNKLIFNFLTFQLQETRRYPSQEPNEYSLCNEHGRISVLLG